ncbi:pentapeptide repeat-containing protein [Micromonospora wenchangensis]|uniref:pentapeptide repeat-containing protein n=1 Tax=Micromonospora wenchangensis TaxID=1185415 RepID=UPI003D76609C
MAIGSLVTAIGSLLSVFFVAIGLYVTNEANRQSSEANREQQLLTAQGQITDRFTKAVEQLGQPGPEKIDVRLGAVYALERIMRDSRVDQPAVIDILAAFIRVHSPAPNRATRPSASRLPVDIQAAVTVLGRRDTTRDGGDLHTPHLWRVRPDLTNTNLTLADLTSANLPLANLVGAYLPMASLYEADLTSANLTAANLTSADLTLANLESADLTSANLAGANLTHANLGGADLIGANLAGANLANANLGGADLTNAILTCAHTDDRTQLPTGMARPAQCG